MPILLLVLVGAGILIMAWGGFRVLIRVLLAAAAIAAIAYFAM